MQLLTIKLSIRNLGRNKIYTAINLAGLGISTAFILLVAVYVFHALRVDRYSSELKNIYRIESASNWRKADPNKKKGLFDWLVKDAGEQNQLVTPLVLGPEIKKNFPEINQVCRIQKTGERHLIINNQRFKLEQGHAALADKNFFDFFGLPVVTANKQHAFSGNKSVVITEAAAQRYFGDEDPVGKVINIKDWDNSLFTVSAVAKNFPGTSSMQFDMLFCIEGLNDYDERMQSGINSSSYLTLIKLKEGTNVNLFRNKIAAFGEIYFKDWVEGSKKYNPDVTDPRVNLTIRSFSESHFNSSGPWFYYTDLKSVYQLIFLALIALGIACLNYVLLSLSRVAVRSQEAGIRKTVGAGWRNIISMFLTETWVLVIIAMIAGFVLAVIALPYFNELTKVRIFISEIVNTQFILIALFLSVILTIVAGIYPAIRMAGIKPLSVLTRFGTYKLNPTLSKVFITLQYTACIALIVFSIVIARQLKFIHEMDLGFDKAQTVIVQNPYWGDKVKTVSLRDQLYHYASTQSAIEGATGSAFRYGHPGNINGHNIDGKKIMIYQNLVDYDFFEVYKIPMVSGRSFSRQFATDTSRLDIAKEKLDSTSNQMRSNLVVNETLYNLLGKPPLNELNRPLGGYIVGVCKDYFFDGLQQKIAPAYHMCRPDRLGYFWFKIGKGQNLASAVAGLKANFEKDTNGEDFSYSFMDEDVAVLYESNERWLKVISFASWMAIFIASLGLFGLSAIVAVNRTKEIGIRKVMGASVPQLFYTLNRQSLIMVLFSIVLAVPIAIYISYGWLEDFAYRIDIGWQYFLLAAAIGFLCALIAVSYHTLKAASINPVKSLRSE